MSVDFYSDQYFKGIKFSLDIGTFYKEHFNRLTIGSMIINDNVQVVIRYGNGHQIKFCGQQIKQKIDIIKNITYVNVKHSICDPYTDKNSILNKYSIGKNYSIQFNKNLVPVLGQENLKNGLIDFWYNSQVNKQGKYYTVGNPSYDPVENTFKNDLIVDTYNTAVKDLHNYSLNNKWFDENEHIKHNKNALYKHWKEYSPMTNTNNIADCKFDCGRISKTFRRKLCDIRCKPNTVANNRMANKMNHTNKCYNEAEIISYGNVINDGLYKKVGKGISNIEIPIKQKQELKNEHKYIENKYRKPDPEIWNNNVDYIEPFNVNLNRKYGQYHMYPDELNPNQDQALVKLYTGSNFTGNYLELSDGFFLMSKFNFFDKIGSMRVKPNVDVVLFDKNNDILQILKGPYEGPIFMDNIFDQIVTIHIIRKNCIEHFGKNNENNNKLFIIVILLIFCVFFGYKM